MMSKMLKISLACLTACLFVGNLSADDAPKVTTNKRFARGATMAFGRLTATGTNITERGFCYSESPEPTIDDERTTETFSNNGLIYWLKNLKPATRYYMRAYAINSDNQVGYGDILKFYTIPKGNISFSMREGGDAAAVARIKAAAETTMDYWNNLTEMKGFHSSIGHVDGVPTAECSYGGWMSVGSNQSYQRPGTIMHELLHGVGVIPWADTEWSRHNLRASVNGEGYGTGQWLGDRVTEVVRFLENNSSSVLNGDYQHMWPYGINGAHEDSGTTGLYVGNALICQALGEDGLQHTGSLFAEPYYALDQEDDIKYYLKNEDDNYGLFTGYLMQTENGELTWRDMTAEEVVKNDSAAWYVTFTPENQYYQFRNAATGRYMTYTGSAVKTAQRTSPVANDNFHLMMGRADVKMGTTNTKLRGYWMIHPTSNWTPSCLVASLNGKTATATFNIANDAKSQRWLILTAEQVSTAEVTATVALSRKLSTAIQQAKKLLDVPHQENVAGADQQFADVLTHAEGAAAITLSEATSESFLAIINSMDDVKKATKEFLGSVTVTNIEQPFDLTYLITNPGMDATDGWSESPTLANSCAEFYQQKFDFYQDMEDMPAGNYQMKVQAFQRPGTAAAAYTAYEKGADKVNAYAYLADESVLISQICSGAQTKKVGGTEATVGDNLYIPADMQAARRYFNKKLYDNTVDALLGEAGTLRFGVRSSSMPGNYWVCLDNFRLYYFGDLSRQVTAIGNVEATVQRRVDETSVYDLQGRRVKEVSKPGVYVYSGKKVVR